MLLLHLSLPLKTDGLFLALLLSLSLGCLQPGIRTESGPLLSSTRLEDLLSLGETQDANPLLDGAALVQYKTHLTLVEPRLN